MAVQFRPCSTSPGGGGQTQVTFYNSWKRAQRLNSLLMHGVTGAGIDCSQSARAQWRRSSWLQPSSISLIWHRRTQQFTAHISRKDICHVQFNARIILNYLYRLLRISWSRLMDDEWKHPADKGPSGLPTHLSACSNSSLWIALCFREQQSGGEGQTLSCSPQHAPFEWLACRHCCLE